MPNLVQIPDVDPVDFTVESIKEAIDLSRDNEALTLVNSQFFQFRNWRNNNIEPDWMKSDSLYLGLVQQRFWDGTKVPRASMPWPIAFEHVEVAYAQIYESLFSQPDWFSIEADADVAPEEAHAMQTQLRYYLDHDREQFGVSAPMEIGQSVKDILRYGVGCMALEWDGERNRPIWSYVDLKEVYTDPQAKSPIVDFSRALIRRSLITIEQVKAWSGIPGIKIPSDDVLYTLATHTNGYDDRARDIQDAMLGREIVSSNPYTQYTPQLLIEVLTYWSKTKHIIVLGGQRVILNAENPYKMIPYVMAPCTMQPGRLHGRSIPDVIEKNQRYIEGLLNSRLDEISLALNPPRASKQATNFTPTSRMWHPGMNMPFQNPKDDFIIQPPSNVTATALEEINMIGVMGEKLDGINSHMSGVPRGGNSNRTATGMTQQLQAGQLRTMMVVRNIEDYLLVPALYKTIKMIEYHQAGERPDENGEMQPRLPYEKCRFKVFASNRMLSRDGIMQAFPFIMQYVSNGTFLQQLASTGKTVDFESLFSLLTEATRLGRTYNFVRPLNEQEQQSLSQPPPEVVAQSQQKDKELQAKMQIEQMKLGAANDPQAKQMELEIEARKAEMDLQMKQMEMATKERMLQLQTRQKEMELQLKAFEAQMNMRNTAQEAQLQSEVSRQQHEQSLIQQQQQHEMSQAHAEQAAESNRQQVDVENQQKNDFAHEQAEIKLKQLSMKKPNPSTPAKK